MSERLALKVKLPIAVSFTILLVIVVLAGLAYQEVRRAHLDAAHERLMRVSTQLADLTSMANEQRLALVDSIAAQPELVSFLRWPRAPGGSDGAVATLDEGLRSIQSIGYELLDERGARVLSSAASETAPPAGPSAAAPGIGEMVATHGALVYSVSAPVVDEDATIGTVRYWREAARVDEDGRRLLQDLLGARTGILIGSLGGAWSDLSGRIDPPPESALTGLTSGRRSDGGNPRSSGGSCHSR